MNIIHDVAKAGVAFESRWQYAALKRVDPDLHARFFEQLEIFNAACRSHDDDAITRQGNALLRGFAAITNAMMLSGEPERPVITGLGPHGLRICVGQDSSGIHNAEPGEVFLTGDEVAALLEEHPDIVNIKRLFPGTSIEKAGPATPPPVEPPPFDNPFAN